MTAAAARIRRLGGMVALAVGALTALAGAPSAWGRELGAQLAFIARRALPPVLVACFAWGFALPGITAGNFFAVFGTADRSGGYMLVQLVREVSSITTASVILGVAGAHYVADLGGRKVRGELRGLELSGGDPVRDLVLPRVLALAVATGAFSVIGVVAGAAGGYAATELTLDATGVVDSLFANASVADVVVTALKTTLIGGVVGVICCYKALNAAEEREGVARATTQAAVASTIAILLLSLIVTQYFLGVFPEGRVSR